MIRDYQEFSLWDKKVFEKVVLDPPFRLIARMPNEACFYYIVEGQAKMIAPTHELIGKASEGVVLRCGNYLNHFLKGTESQRCIAIAIHFYPEVLKMIYDKEFPDFLLNVHQIKPIKIQRVPTDSLMKNYIESLQFYFNNPALVSDELLKLKLKELILLLAKTNNAKVIQSLIAGMFSREVLDFKAVIEANLFNNLTLEELSALTHLSLSSFKREFVKQYDCSPAKYIRQRKLEKAAKLLKSTRLRISEIAFDCGFKDLAHFSKSFQRVYQTAPSEYRAIN